MFPEEGVEFAGYAICEGVKLLVGVLEGAGRGGGRGTRTLLDGLLFLCGGAAHGGIGLGGARELEDVADVGGGHARERGGIGEAEYSLAIGDIKAIYLP